MDHNNHAYYTDNQKYTTFLDTQDRKVFDKYIDMIVKYTPTKGKFLDVGCGSGLVLEILKKKHIHASGIEIAKTSVALCQEKKLDCQWFDGEKIPYKKNTFDMVGSINVLEHTNHPINFLDENLRVLKKGGYLIIVTPNFLSITNGFHKNTRGLKQKAKNIATLASFSFQKEIVFGKMIPIDKENFEPDDDAVNITNPVSIKKWGKKHGLQEVYWSSQWLYNQGLANTIDKGMLKTFLGSVFVIFKK